MLENPLDGLIRIDRAIAQFDLALRTLTGVHAAARESPSAKVEEAPLSDAEKRDAAALMRVNHVGEVCAQALYQGQALAARQGALRKSLARAAREEQDHLAWSAQRIRELGGRPSLLNPVWYAGSLAIGLAAGLAGERWNLGFLAETERQVEEHLTGHLERLPAQDLRTRTLVAAMRAEEAQHRQTAIALGAAELPAPAKFLMRAASRVMTAVAFHL